MSDKFPPVYPVPVIGLGKYKCSACNRVFNTEEDARDHIKIAHPEETEPEAAEKIVIKDLGYELPKKEKETNKEIDEVKTDKASKRLKIVTLQESFLFFTDHDQYTGQYASSLDDFAQKLNDVPLKSVEFHYARGDFSKWIKDIFGDEFLANRIDHVGKSLKGVELRNAIKRIVEKRVNELKH